MPEKPTQPTHDSPPEEWAALLTDGEWRAAVCALGVDRLKEERPMIAQFTPRFRSLFVHQLADLDGYEPGRKVWLALARCTHELLEDTATKAAGVVG